MKPSFGTNLELGFPPVKKLYAMRKRMKKYFLLIQNFRIRLQNLFRSQIRKPQSTFQNYNIQKVKL